MALDPAQCFEALRARDARFDGVFFVAVSTTGIYCRPICRVRLPRADHCSFFPNAPAAEQAGYRPCLRCRPELAPGNAPADAMQRIAARAAVRIQAGALNGAGLEVLAADLGVSARQLRRAVLREYGVPPVALAQTARLLLAKQLLTDSSLGVAEIAFASGFGSLRRFNQLFRSRYGMPPTALRRRAGPAAESPAIELRLGYRPPLAWRELVTFLSSRSSARIVQREGTRLLHTVCLGGRTGWIAAEPDTREGRIRVAIAPTLLPALPELLPRLRHLLDLDANPEVIRAGLHRDPCLASCLQRRPGLRVPGGIDGFEIALRAVVGQQVSVKAATTIFSRLVAAFGMPVDTPFPGLDRTAPDPADIADAGAQRLIDQGLTGRRAETVIGLARAMAQGSVRLAPDSPPADTVAALLELPGIGPWTAQYIAMRALADPDAFPHSDLGLLRATGCERPEELLARSRAWSPWRAYAAIHLWTELNAGG